jgi:predicted Zn-dependent protease
LDVGGLARLALERAQAAREPIDVAPGVHDVLLQPAAVKEILEWLAFTAFGARSILDGTSPLAGRVGEAVFGENVTIVDDPISADGGSTPRPFDGWGVPSRPVVLVEGGVARGCVSDTITAARLGAPSTGHGPDPGDEDDPVPAHLRLAAGDAPRESLVARLERGLVVTRFHYVNGLLDTRRALMTGLTRDGVYRVEDGRVAGAARNLRWTQSIIEAFGRIEAISRETELVPTWWSAGSAFRVPALLVRGWTFDSAAGT